VARFLSQSVLNCCFHSVWGGEGGTTGLRLLQQAILCNGKALASIADAASELCDFSHACVLPGLPSC
jgi:hypothetical protein